VKTNFDKLVEERGVEQVIDALEAVLDLNLILGEFRVFEFYKAPKVLREFCNYNGGDEDWLTVCHTEDYNNLFSSWLDRTDSCQEPDIYELKKYTIVIGSHA